MDLYREEILDHYRHPHNFGHLDDPTSKAEEYNAVCGDQIAMEVRITDGKVEDIRFSGQGCAISMASASLLTDMVLDMTVSDVLALQTQDILELLHATLTPTRVKCAVLPLQALHAALAGTD